MTENFATFTDFSLRTNVMIAARHVRCVKEVQGPNGGTIIEYDGGFVHVTATFAEVQDALDFS